MKDFDSLKIAVAGTGYVGLSLATLLAQHHQVTAVDIVPAKVDMIKPVSPRSRTITSRSTLRRRSWTSLPRWMVKAHTATPIS